MYRKMSPEELARALKAKYYIGWFELDRRGNQKFVYAGLEEIADFISSQKVGADSVPIPITDEIIADMGPKIDIEE